MKIREADTLTMRDQKNNGVIPAAFFSLCTPTNFKNLRQCLAKRTIQAECFEFQVSSLLRKIDKIQNMMNHCLQLAIAIRGEQWLDTK